MARSEPMADVSLPIIRARSRPGTAIAAMMPMRATTISSSISVKPSLLFRQRTLFTFESLTVQVESNGNATGSNRGVQRQRATRHAELPRKAVGSPDARGHFLADQVDTSCHGP